jgi:hypothetical protein
VIVRRPPFGSVSAPSGRICGAEEQVKAILDRVPTWPPERQEDAAEIILEIAAEIRSRVHHATPDELRALDEAEQSGTASDDEVEAAFRSFRRAVYSLDDEERADVREAIAEMERDEVASDEEVKATFDALRK